MGLKPDTDMERPTVADVSESPLAALWQGLMFLLILPFAAAGFLWRQVRGTGESLVGFYRWVQLDYVLPPAIRGTIQWTIGIVPEAMGLRDTSKYRQVSSAFVLLVVAFLSTLLTGGLAIAIYVTVAVFFGIGLGRFVPAVNRGWKSAREKLPVKDNYDVPRWSRE